ncbi:YjbH domain-containing protein [Pseudoalteromonas phenolica]|uniref:Bacterial putative lipoprotein (DUF940) n=1 Tax=Pseudoalteromonas phenolica TaxID=161398 RepID=A0A0S2JYW2_9GAMM|nr:YjbH domain-containing protein [Pseudoalteromonas phenolica]ALO40958.1 Bacterial putative lipoprotein (DUF940) [Pseudoalteromonas phenolica]MBE0354520.1 hypothetical protein [Pseudoalteromonas phenolica O-BC30]
MQKMIFSKKPLLAMGLLYSFSSCATDDLKNYKNFTGFSGIINTPNSQIMPKGFVDFGYNNQLDYFGNQYLDAHNFVFSAGLLDNLEVSGLIATNSMHDNLFSSSSNDPLVQIRDLSFNAKYKIPFVPKNWFSFALGAKDVGGAANNYETYFAVASKEWSDFRFSLGIGTSEHSTGMMNGAFGGIEWMPLDWFALQVEHDAEAVNAAARLTVPKEWLFDIGELSFTSRFYSNTDYSENDSTYYGVNFTMPLSSQARKNYKEIKPAPAVAAEKNLKSPDLSKPTLLNERVSENKKPVTAKAGTSEDYIAHSSKIQNVSLTSQVHRLKLALIEDGFENISIGFNDTPNIVVKFENRVFNRNDIDALGLVMGRIGEFITEDQARFLIQLEKSDIALLNIQGSVANYRQFIEQGISPDLDIRQGSVATPSGIMWVGNTAEQSPYFLPRVTFSPALAATYATELGVYDFSLALRADIEVPLWKGAGVNITMQEVVADTEDFEKGDSFEGRRLKGGLNQAVFYQAVELPFNIYNLTQVGMFRDYFDYYGFINETTWVSPGGRHQLSANIAKFEYQDYELSRDYYLAEYQYNWSEQDITLHASMGKFWALDEGVKVESRFWFGDSYIAIYAADTVSQQVGISFSIPLSSRKDMSVTPYGQVKGNEAWRHGVTTRIGESHNALIRGQASKMYTRINMERTFLNQGRNSSSYVYANLARLREAYLTYK